MADLNSDKIVLLDTLYETYSLPSSLAGVERLYKAARSIDRNIRLSDVRQYLRGKDSYTLHKTTKKKFPRRKMIAAKPSTIISCDLADLRKLSRYNNGINYLLVCIDIFSRYVKIVPLKKKMLQLF